MTRIVADSADRNRCGRPNGYDQWQCHDELAALSVASTSGLDGSAVHVNQPLHEGEPNPKSTAGGVASAIDLNKDVEHPRQHFLCDPDPCIPDGQYCGATFSSNRERDVAARISELRGID